jgi:hypothetical protein
MRKALLVVFMLFLISLLSGVTVYEIQYTTDPSGASPLEGEIVTVTGIVTATNWYVSGNSNRFFISDPEGGEWRGIFIFNWDYAVEQGDEVEVTGEVVEYYGFTEITNITEITVLSTGNPVPEPIDVTTGDLAETEAYEGVLVRVNDVVVTQNPNNYGEAYIDDGSGECQTDDAMYSYDPAIGDEYDFIIGIVDYSYDQYGLNPRYASDLAIAGEPGYIEGMVSLDGGSGEVQNVIVSAGGYTTNPDNSGEYELQLPPGTYSVTASLAGYAPQTITEVEVEEEETTSGINFTLIPQEEVTIYDIQFTEDPSGDSPYAGQVVTVSGIVSGTEFNGNNFFFISGEDGGAWNGLYVYQYDYEVTEGDNVTITGTISEYFGFTELTDITELVVNSSGNAVPPAIEITTAELAGMEAYESVLVKISDVEVTALPNTYNEWYVDDGSGACQIDDGFGVIYADLSLGFEFLSIKGIVDYSYDEYGLHPRRLSDFDSGTQPEFTPIYDIQYTEDPTGDSPLAGEIVTVQGIVTGSGYLGNRYFIADIEGGAYSGIYVYDDVNDPYQGDIVQFTAEVAEYFGFTELLNVTNFEVVSSGNPLPAPVDITTLQLSSEEAYESVLVRIRDLLVVQEPGEFGEWYVNDGSGACQIDDGFFLLNEVEPPIVIENDMEIVSITGIVDYSYSEFGLNPRTPQDINIDGAPFNDENVIAIYNLVAYPNPYHANNARSGINFGFTLQEAAGINLAVYNIKGQKLTEIAEGYYAAGSYRLSWDGRDSAGQVLPAGVYLYKLSAGSNQESNKILLMR